MTSDFKRINIGIIYKNQNMMFASKMFVFFSVALWVLKNFMTLKLNYLKSQPNLGFDAKDANGCNVFNVFFLQKYEICNEILECI